MRIGDEACDIDFFITYEFKSRALQMLMGSMFDKAFRKFATAFEQRADEIYGRPHPGQCHGVSWSPVLTWHARFP